MCWNKESSLIGFLVNLILLFSHINKKSSSYIPIFATVTLTQLFDFLVYAGYNKNLLNFMLSTNLSLQLFFIYFKFNLPKIFLLIPFAAAIRNLNWKPYKNHRCNKPIDWNEDNTSKLFLWLCWIIIPTLYLIYNNSFQNKDVYFMLSASVLLLIAEKYNFGSIGKNWCMNGVILNLITHFIYN